jgi:hypothetical protein
VAAVKLVKPIFFGLPSAWHSLQISCMFSRFRINRFGEQWNRHGAKKKEKGT